MSLDPTILHLIHEEMKAGFDRVTERLDRMNGTVQDHGRQIAVLEKTLEVQADSLEQASVELDDIAMGFSQHRARCPFDREGGMGFITDEHRALLPQKQQVVVAGGVGAAIAAALTEVLPWVYRKVIGVW